MEIKLDLNVFFTIILKIAHYSSVIIVRFCHRFIIHNDKTIICYFMPRHQTSKLSYNFKAKRYNVSLMNKYQLEPKHFVAFYCDQMKKLNIMRKLP